MKLPQSHFHDGTQPQGCQPGGMPKAGTHNLCGVSSALPNLPLKHKALPGHWCFQSSGETPDKGTKFFYKETKCWCQLVLSCAPHLCWSVTSPSVSVPCPGLVKKRDPGQLEEVEAGDSSVSTARHTEACKRNRQALGSLKLHVLGSRDTSPPV